MNILQDSSKEDGFPRRSTFLEVSEELIAWASYNTQAKKKIFQKRRSSFAEVFEEFITWTSYKSQAKKKVFQERR